MKSARLFSFVCITILFAVVSNAQSNTTAVDRLGVKGPISFDKTVYNLAWSSHPTATYYKQEYLPKGDDVNKFKTMLMVEVATGSFKLKDVVDAKVNELKALAVSNPFISYETSYDAKTDEYILDFVITQNSAGNKSALIAERNVYRYKNLADNKGVMLFAISTRSYGADTKAFLANVKSGRAALVTKVKAHSLPTITIQ